MKAETSLKRAIIDALNATGLVRVWSTPSGRVQAKRGWIHLAPEGTPDVCGFALRDGRFVGIEIKMPKAKTDKSRANVQKAAQSEIRQHGGISGQVDSVSGALALVLDALGPNWLWPSRPRLDT